MSELTPRGVDAEPRPLPLKAVLADLGVAFLWFAVLAVVGGLVWWQVTPLAEYTRTATNAVMDEEQLGVQVSADGWFFVIAAIGGVLSGIVLLSWRRRDPLLMVIACAAGGVLATWVMLRTGLIAGPPNPDTVLPHAREGAKIPLQLTIRADGLWAVWPVTSMLGALGVIWGTDHLADHEDAERNNSLAFPG